MHGKFLPFTITARPPVVDVVDGDNGLGRTNVGGVWLSSRVPGAGASCLVLVLVRMRSHMLRHVGGAIPRFRFPALNPSFLSVSLTHTRTQEPASVSRLKPVTHRAWDMIAVRRGGPILPTPCSEKKKKTQNREGSRGAGVWADGPMTGDWGLLGERTPGVCLAGARATACRWWVTAALALSQLSRNRQKRDG